MFISAFVRIIKHMKQIVDLNLCIAYIDISAACFYRMEREYSSLWVILVCIFPLTDTNWLQAFPVRNSYTIISPSILFFFFLQFIYQMKYLFKSFSKFTDTFSRIIKEEESIILGNKWPSIINLQLLHNNKPFFFFIIPPYV